MKVLIAELDVFTTVGGGQTAYRNLVNHHPEIQFFFFSRNKNSLNNLPSNVCPIEYRPRYLWKDDLGKEKSFKPEWSIDAANLAASVEGQKFDVVDVADYHLYAPYLRAAFEHHRVQADKYFLALHGDMSTTIRLNWPSRKSRDHVVLKIQELEAIAYETFDVRYGLSSRYLQSKENHFPAFNTYCLSPFLFLESFPLIHQFDKSSFGIDLNFIGRHEKRKGPDLFIDLIWNLEPHFLNQVNVNLIGSESASWDGINSTTYLEPFARNRLNQIKFLKSMNREELFKTFQSRSVTFLPSRFDSFNLTALESLLSGCPTVIGDGAGVCDFLDHRFPTIPYVKIGTRNEEESLSKIKYLITHYNDYRDALIQALKKIDFSKELQGAPYSVLVTEASVQHSKESLASSQETFRRLFSLSLPFSTRRNLFNLLYRKRNAYQYIKHRLKGRLPKVYSELYRTRRFNLKLKVFKKLPEETIVQVRRKIRRIHKLCDFFRFGRVNLYLELARLERKAGNLFNSSSYELRIYRLQGRALNEKLEILIKDLNTCGLNQEAEVARLMYASPSCKDILKYLNQRKQKLLTALPYSHEDYEFIDDQRAVDFLPKVSIIVSLYNAESKIETFLDRIFKQTLFLKGQIELVFVDSASPTSEAQVVRKVFSKQNHPFVYVRTRERETIQAAWNRGIYFSKGEFLCFLGVDEALKADACEILSHALDTQLSVDWIMANSLITEVDPSGDHLKDVMIYNREGYTSASHYLECCYLSYVGGMYRRRIHSEVGYYDSTFKGAGDTEFKNRVLPSIHSKHINLLLGLFLNYPDERTTASARVEIEDLRAWYLFRTVGGIKFAFQQKMAELPSHFLSALDYRKSYKLEKSSDVEYSINILKVILESNPDHELRSYLKPLEKMLDCYRKLDELPSLPGWICLISGLLILLTIKRQQQKLRQISGKRDLTFNVLEDNRYEQHFWVWK